jgi:hypothetical protein
MCCCKAANFSNAGVFKVSLPFSILSMLNLFTPSKVARSSWLNPNSFLICLLGCMIYFLSISVIVHNNKMPEKPFPNVVADLADLADLAGNGYINVPSIPPERG